MTDEEKVTNVLYTFVDAGLISKDIERVIGCFSEQITGIGIGEQGFVLSKEDVRRVVTDGKKEDDAAAHYLTYNQIEISIHSGMFAFVCADITVNSVSIDSPSYVSKSGLLQSLAMVKEQGEWKICGLHASTPVLTEEAVEAYPLKFAEKALQILREKIGEEAYAAEEQYRQAILADTVAFYIVDFTLNIFEKCQLNCDWCVYTEPGIPYEKFVNEKSQEYLLEEDKALFLRSFSMEHVKKAFLENQKELSCEYRMVLSDGQELWVVTIVRLITDIVTGHQKGIMYVKNIDQSKRAELRIKKQATYDGMTKVYNKVALCTFISEHLLHGGGIFAILDVDDLKHINDTYGHPVGDLVLIAVTRELKDTFKKTALIGRMGGDEFGVFIPNEKLNAEKKEKFTALVERINRIQIPDNAKIQVACSLGAIDCEVQMDFDEIYKKADSVLYLSKKSGKNKISYL